jgi:dipeptidyl aminopeptidase/acylaminoacyl peptidase
VVYGHGGSLFAVPFDARKLEVAGTPFKVVDGVFMSTNSGSAYFDISTTGALAYAAGRPEGGERTLVWVDRKGNPEPLPLPQRSYLFPRVAPDGRLVAFEIEGVNHDIYTYDSSRGVTTKLTTDGVSHAPVWTPDSKRIAFRSWKAGSMTMWWMPADHSAPEERLIPAGIRQSLVGFSPDGGYAAFNQMEPGSPFSSDVYVLPLRGERVPEAVAKSKFMKGSGRFSRDGKWIAYCSTESGRAEVYVQSWPGPGPRIQVSSEGGTDPTWSPDGKELVYRNGDRMMTVAVTTQPAFKASRPQVLWEGHYSHGMGNSCGMPGVASANYDISPDGRRFLMIKDVDQDAVSTRIVVVLNFAEELKRLDEERKQQTKGK